MTNQKLVITKATEEEMRTIDAAAKIENRSRSNFVKTHSYRIAKKILEEAAGNDTSS